MGYKIDLSGNRYGKLVVLRYSHNDNRRKSYWVCRCDCGNETVVSGSNLKSGNSSSCGCGELENRKRLMDAFTETHLKHGQSYSRIHRIWSHMIDRCLNPKCGDYPLYGGRGISVCPAWLGTDGFENFYKWAASVGYSDELTIDRKDVNGNYEPSNCRWSDAEGQANNRRTNICFELHGEVKTLAEWCKVYGKNYSKIYFRINEMGMALEDALKD